MGYDTMKSLFLCFAIFMFFTTVANAGSKLVGSVVFYTTAAEGAPERFVHQSSYNEDFQTVEICNSFKTEIEANELQIETVQVYNEGSSKSGKSKEGEYKLVRLSTLQCIDVQAAN